MTHIESELYLPNNRHNTSDKPLCVVFGGSGGGYHFSRNMARKLSEEEFPALAVAYFGLPGLPVTLNEIPLEYFEAAWQQAMGEVGNRPIVVIGRSRGGELALLLGAHFHQVKGVVAYAPSHVGWGVFGSDKSSWTYKNTPIPFVPLDSNLFSQTIKAYVNKTPIALTPWFEQCLAKYSDSSTAVIKVENINGPVLLVSGKADDLWPSSKYAGLIADRLLENNFTFEVTNLQYENVGHAFDIPGEPFTNDDRWMTVDGNKFSLGGDEAATIAAEEDSWTYLISFLSLTSACTEI